jgi:hypothetical protein
MRLDIYTGRIIAFINASACFSACETSALVEKNSSARFPQRVLKFEYKIFSSVLLSYICTALNFDHFTVIENLLYGFYSGFF